MINKKWRQFIKDHLEKKSESQKNYLTKKNLYIFPNFNGFKLGVFILFSFTSSIFYQNNVGLLISIILFIIYFISIIISYQNLNNLKIVPLSFLVPQKTKLYLSFLFQILNKQEKLNLNISLNKKRENINLTNNQKLNFGHTFTKRGTQNIPQIHLESVFPFGIIKAFGIVRFKEKLHVYPEPIRPPSFVMSQLRYKDLLNENDYEFDTIVEGKPGENMSRVSWRHYSTMNKLLIKKFTSVKNNNKIVIDIEKLNSSNFELSLSYTVYLIEYFYNQKINFAIKYKNYFSNYSYSLQHKKELLKFIANV